MSQHETKSGLTFSSLLQLLFIALKLTGVINWPWIWVLSPMWISLILVCIILFIWWVVYRRFHP